MSKKWSFCNHRAGEKDSYTNVDITDRGQAEEALQHQLEFERIVARISTAFVNIDYEELDDAINNALRLSGEFFHVDRSYIFQFTPDRKMMNNTHEWCAPGVEPQIDNLQNNPTAAFPWWVRELNRFKHINVPDVDSMPPEAEAEKELLKAQDIQSVLVVPLVHRHKLIGFLGFDAVRQPKRWAEAQIFLLKIVSEIISGTLARAEAEKELREREALQQLLMKLSTRFVNVPLEKVDTAIDEMLETIGRFTNADRVYIFNHDYERRVTTNTHEWCADGIAPEIHNLQGTPFHLFTDILETHQKGEIVHIPDVGEMPGDHGMRPVFEQQGIKSLIMLPLLHNNNCIGFVGFDAVRAVRHFTESEISLLKVLAELISNIMLRRRSEKELQESERRFRALVQNTPDIIAIVNDKGEYCYASPSLERVMGYTPAEQEKLNALDLLHPDDREMAASLFGGLLQRPGDTIGIEFRMRHRDGSYRYINALGHNLIADPSVGGVVVNARDVTEQKRAAAETEEALVKFKATFENTRDAITLCALKSNIFVDCNTRALELFGLDSKEEFLDKHPSDFSPPLQPDGQDSAACSGELVKELLREWGSTSFEWLHQRKDGSTFPAEVTLTTYKLADDVILQANIRDISYRKEVEQKLAAYTRELEQLYAHLDAEMDKARRIHKRAFSASFPRVEGFTFAAHYQPAQRLGGDFYDVIRVDNKLVLYLSDVMGHGIDGAMLSLFVKEAIESYVSLKKNELEPHKILHHLNTQYRKSNYPDDYFIAIFLSVLDLDRMELNYTAAGFQDAPLVACRGGERYELLARSLPISSTLEQELFALQTEKIKLAPGMCILFNTDGLTEQPVKEGYYYQRLKEVFYSNSHLPAPEMLQAVIEDFQLVNNGSLQGDDDITLLVMQLEDD